MRRGVSRAGAGRRGLRIYGVEPVRQRGDQPNVEEVDVKQLAQVLALHLRDGGEEGGSSGGGGVWEERRERLGPVEGAVDRGTKWLSGRSGECLRGGCVTLTTTSSPECSRARWTCARLAAASGASSKLAKSSSTGLPSSRLTSCFARLPGKPGTSF